MADAGDSILKVLVLGDPATGKTSIIKRYVMNLFTEHHKTTVGVDFTLKQVTVDSKSVRLQLWDIAGQDRFGAIARVYYKDAFGAMLVFDLSRRATFDTVKNWKDEIDAKVSLPDGQPLPVMLVGNKMDLDQREVEEGELQAFCERNNFIGYKLTSAKMAENNGIAEMAQTLVKKILEHETIFSDPAPKDEGFVRPTAEDWDRAQQNRGSGCAC